MADRDHRFWSYNVITDKSGKRLGAPFSGESGDNEAELRRRTNRNNAQWSKKNKLHSVKLVKIVDRQAKKKVVHGRSKDPLAGLFNF